MMKLLKKSSLVALALILCASNIASTNVLAAGNTYLKGDIDGDGSITLSDLGYLANFLHGVKGSANDNLTQRLDVDSSGVIDHNDQSLLSSILVGDVNTYSLSYSSTSSEIPNQTSESYGKYDAQTGNKIGENYDLNPVSNISSRSIIGDDNRYADYNNHGVVSLSYTKGNQSYIATGFVVGTHKILTAAHCVYDTTNNRPAKNVCYTVYGNSENSSTTYSAVNYHIPQRYVDLNSYDPIYDYAIITVNETFSDDYIMELGIARDIISNNTPSTIYQNYLNKPCIYVTGHSSSMTTGYGNLISGYNNVILDDYIINYSSDMVGGESGGPVYVKTQDGKITVIAINSGGTSTYNVGRRIDSNILHFVYNNPNLWGDFLWKRK